MAERAAHPRQHDAPDAREDEGGFASIDALVALTILSLGLALCLRATDIARHVGDQARETTQAELMMRGVLDTADPNPGSATGRRDGFAWTYSSAIAALPGVAQASEICAREVRVRSDASGRSFSLATLSGCGR